MGKMVKCKTCGADIAKSAKACPFCGAKQKRHTVLGIILVIIGIAIFAQGISNFDTSKNDGSEGNHKNKAENEPTISLDEFNEITTGMTYDEVVDIIGSEGKVLSEVDMNLGEEFKTTMYTWEGEGSLGANANVTIQGGKVTAKAQIGLK